MIKGVAIPSVFSFSSFASNAPSSSESGSSCCLINSSTPIDFTCSKSPGRAPKVKRDKTCATRWSPASTPFFSAARDCDWAAAPEICAQIRKRETATASIERAERSFVLLIFLSLFKIRLNRRVIRLAQPRVRNKRHEIITAKCQVNDRAQMKQELRSLWIQPLALPLGECFFFFKQKTAYEM